MHGIHGINYDITGVNLVFMLLSNKILAYCNTGNVKKVLQAQRAEVKYLYFYIGFKSYYFNRGTFLN